MVELFISEIKTKPLEGLLIKIITNNPNNGQVNCDDIIIYLNNKKQNLNISKDLTI